MRGRPSAGLIRPHENKLGLIKRAVDGLLIAGANGIACGVTQHAWEDNQTLAVALAVPVFLLAGEANGLYGSWRAIPVRAQARAVAASWLFTVPALLLFAFAFKTSADYSRRVTVAWFVLSPIVLVVSRAVVRVTLSRLRARGFNAKTVAIVGATDLGLQLAGQLREHTWMGLHLTGFYDDRVQARRAAVPEAVGEYRGGFDELIRAATAGDIDIVYVALPLRAESRIRELIRALANTCASVYMVADLLPLSLLRAEWGAVGEMPVVSVVETPFAGIDGFVKRVEDLVLGALILGIIAGPMLLLAILVKLTSKGPVLFRQRRYGLNGEEIEVLKFRSMRVCEDGARIVQATRDDPRVTKLGAFMRRTSLDELPQFINVLRGDMSIVGPRPHAVAHNEEYRRIIHGYMIRHKVKPGITGWAQVNGWRGETDTLEKMERRVEHDLQYIRGWSLGWDLKIILLTVLGSAARKNAY